MQDVMIDFIISLDGCAAADGWPGLWGVESQEYLESLGGQDADDHTVLMGAKTYRLMSGFAADCRTTPASSRWRRCPRSSARRRWTSPSRGRTPLS